MKYIETETKDLYLNTENNQLYSNTELEITEYKGVKSKFFNPVMSEETYQYIINNFYEKSDYQTQLTNIVNRKGQMVNKIYANLFENLANDTVLHHSKFSINEVLNDKILLSTMYNKTFSNDKVYTGTLIQNVKTVFRIGGKGFAQKPTNFPLKTMDLLLQKYTKIGDTYYDPCAGWGVRMLGAARNGVNYIGVDTNRELCKNLNVLGENINEIKKFDFTILNHGSEIDFEIGKKVDFIFTSPPYFNLEQYVDMPKMGYQDWLNNFVEPMVKNCHKFLKNGGFVAININNFKNFDLYGDTFNIMKKYFEYHEELELNNIQRINSKKELNDNSEKIMVFRKE
jgi:DNA modification methylase